jgi:protein-S-isoprenylcysteine O-methyltransferase Ste14
MKKIFPPTHFYIYLFISILLHFLLPVKQIIYSPATYFGWILIIAGSALNIWTDQLFKKHKTTVKPDEKPAKLIDYGPFKFSRNPMYLGMAAFLLGVGIFLGSITSFIGTIFFIIAMEFFFIPDEEKVMLEAFGEQYKNYKIKVRRWI